MKSGIYKISFKGSSKYYIGSSKDINCRIKQHEGQLKKDIHSNIHLQRLFNKYKEFKYEIIEYCPDCDLIKREQYYIDKLSPQINICPIAGVVSNNGCMSNQYEFSDPYIQNKINRAAKMGMAIGFIIYVIKFRFIDISWFILKHNVLTKTK